MGVKVSKRMHAALDVGQLGEDELRALIAAILQAAPQSALYAASPVVKSSVTSLVAAAAVLKTADDAVSADQTKLALDLQKQADARFVIVNGLVQLRALVETTAGSEADMKSIGFASITKQIAGAIEIPSVAVFYPKTGHGRAKVTAVLSGKGGRFDAQYCFDPMAQHTWVDFDGYGRSHWLTGSPSGTVVWVRFRTLRGHAKSDWCAPVSVTIP